MNRLFQTLRGMANRPRPDQPDDESQSDAPQALNGITGFDNRIEVLTKYAERASAYEDDLLLNYEQIAENLSQLQQLMEMALDDTRDRDALEYLRLAVRLRPQRDLLEREIRAFTAVADELLRKIETLLENLDEARAYAQDGSFSPAATFMLDKVMTKLTRYFVLLERVAVARHKDLKQRLLAQMMLVIDDRQLDLELAQFILSRRKALSSGNE
jgi:hypothetical protein